MSEDPPESPPPPADDPTRRRFFQVAACALGTGVGAAVVIPAARLVAHPVGRKIVVAGDAPLDAIAADQVGTEPVRVAMVAPTVRDAYAAQSDVVLGAAWLRRGGDGQIVALSSVCPHKGCTVGYAAERQRYECPCHSATFDVEGRRLSGPSERDLDPLPVSIDRGRVRVRWVRYQPGGRDRRPA